MTSPEFIRQAELDLAGCLLVEPEETIRTTTGIVSSGDFLSGAVRALFKAAASLVHAGKACDPTLIQARAFNDGTEVDSQFCAECMSQYLTTANVAETARIIHEAAIQRKAGEIGIALANGETGAVEALSRLQDLIRERGSKIPTPAEDADSVMDYISAAASGKTKPFMRTGYPSLDEKLSGGLVAGGLITLAARPGTGKTTAALNIAENIANAGGTVLYFSLEMTREQLWSCRAASFSGISRSSIYAGTLKDWSTLTDTFNELSKRPFFIRDKPSTVEDIEREARCIDNLALVVVDHIGLVTPTMRGSRYEIMTSITHQLKQLALALKVPILALCQLNRASEQRETKRPNMADLRDSGAIEEDSDVVMLLFREAQYLPPEDQPKPWEDQSIDFILDKNRHGTTGIVTLTYNGSKARIS